MASGQTYATWATTLCGLQKTVKFSVKSEQNSHLNYVNEQICGIIIKETAHADVCHQCLLDPAASLENVLKMAQTYIRTLETEKVLKGDNKTKDVSIV